MTNANLDVRREKRVLHGPENYGGIKAGPVVVNSAVRVEIESQICRRDFKS